MKAIVKKYGFAIYAIVALIHLAAIAFAWEEIRFFSKPILMPLLALAVFANAKAGKERLLIIIALLFSFAGDCFLLVDYMNPLFFIFGLISFLLTHILYIVYFLLVKPARPSLLKKYPWIVLLVVAYGFALVFFLYPKLGDLSIPVMVYAIVICSMLLCSIHIFNRVNSAAGKLFIAGAFSFVLSDSLLAIDKFNAHFPYAAILIMTTYCAAQYCIAKGFVKANA